MVIATLEIERYGTDLASAELTQICGIGHLTEIKMTTLSFGK